MNNSTLSMLLGTALLASIGISASAAPKPAAMGKDQTPFSRMRKAGPTQRWSNSEAMGQRHMRVAPYFTTPSSDSFQYVYAPDGSLWYAICKYETEDIKHNEYYTEHELKGFTITIYDSKFNEIGKVRDNIEMIGDELRCADIMLASQVTKQFFNNDANYELMVSFAMNTPDHVVNIRTKAYALKNLAEEELSTPISVIQGYPVDAVDCAKDKWSEDYYITFLTDINPTEPEEGQSYIDFLAGYKKVLTTYGKGVKQVMEKSIRQLDLPGDQMNSPMMLCKKVDGRLTLTYAQYEKSFFVDPSGMGGNEELTPDNNLLIEVYQMNDSYPAEMELVNTTKIPAVQNTDDPEVYCTYYGIGTLSWDDDVDFEHYTSDGRPAFVVTTDEYLFSDDDHYNSSYYVYDADGNRIKTIAENTFGYVYMSDIPGFEPQVMFIHMGDDMNFEFVDVYSCQTVTKVDHMYRGYSLSISTDRIPSGDGYVYASALSTGLPIDDTHLGAPVCWIDADGEFIRLDLIPGGEGVELAQTYMNADGLGPYVFNTDDDMEYMMLVKRRVPGQDALREELVISSPTKGVLHTFTAEEDKGAIRTVFMMAGANPQMVICYLNDDDKFTTSAYALPFDSALKGAGTVDEPYLIASGGDLQMIKNAPAAYYRLANDIDCASLDCYPIDDFTGTLDGAGHTISNLRLVTRNDGKTGLFLYTSNATVKDLNFYNAKMVLSGSFESGLIAANATKTKFQNIHVRRLSAIGDKFGGEFGGIAGKSCLQTAFNGCEVVGADINLPSSPCMGGIVGEVRTGTTATGCAVSGNLTAQSTLGGIVGSTTTGDEVFSQCHVDANLKAENTIGGIVGFLDRSKVKNNYVEGTLEATKPSKWNNTISLGGIAGELEGDWQGNADVPIAQNLIGISSFTYPSLEGVQAQSPRQLTTVHRVVGRTSYNAYLEEEPNKIIAENGVYNNYIVSDLAIIDSDYSNIEGSTMDKEEVDIDWLENSLGFVFGQSDATPWNIQSWYAYDPSLYYESIAYIPTQEIEVEKGKTFEVEIAILSRDALSEEDVVGGFMCEFDESLLEMTGRMTFDGKSMKVEFSALNEGETPVSVSILDGKAECLVKVNGAMAVEGIESASSALSVSGGIVAAEGCSITIYDLNGKAMLSGRDRVNTNQLEAGVYVATASDCNGKTSSVKFIR